MVIYINCSKNAKIGKKRLQDDKTTRQQVFFDTRNSELQNLRRTLAFELFLKYKKFRISETQKDFEL